MSDLISRQAAIRYVKTECNPYGKPTLDFEGSKKVIEHLKRMPSAQSEPRWIPVDEQLPTPNVFIGNVQKYYLIQNEYGDMMVAAYRKNDSGHTWWEQIYVYKSVEDKVIAWMPLPEPYKEEIEDEQS